MKIRVTALIAIPCIMGWATANAQVDSITYDQNRVFYGSYYQGADVANHDAAEDFFMSATGTPPQMPVGIADMIRIRCA